MRKDRRAQRYVRGRGSEEIWSKETGEHDDEDDALCAESSVMVRNEGKNAQRMRTGIEVDGREKMKTKQGCEWMLFFLMPMGASNTSHIGPKAPGRSQAPLLRHPAPVWLNALAFMLSYRTRSEGGTQQSWVRCNESSARDNVFPNFEAHTRTDTVTASP